MDGSLMTPSKLTSEGEVKNGHIAGKVVHKTRCTTIAGTTTEQCTVYFREAKKQHDTIGVS